MKIFKNPIIFCGVNCEGMKAGGTKIQWPSKKLNNLNVLNI